MKRIKNSIHKFDKKTHFVVKIMVLFSLMLFVNITLTEAYNKWSPSEWWFKYYEPKVESVILDDGTIEFSSHSEYKRSVNVDWYETLWCERNDGTIYRGDTQHTFDFKIKGATSNPLATWGYGDFPPRESVSSCVLCGSILVKTPANILSPDGYPKVDSYCTKEFKY